MLQVGTLAPGFSLPDQDGVMRSLREFRGRKVILYFYPKDLTSGCSKQACGFSERYPHFREKGVEVLGVSKDSVQSHKRFAEKFGLAFPLLADPELGVVRTTYLIDENGVIIRAQDKVKAADNPEEMLQAVEG